MTLSVAVMAMPAAGCGGGGGSSSSSNSSTGAGGKANQLSHGQTIAPRATAKPTAQLPPGDAGYLTADYERATYESLLAGIASGRATGAARSYARTTLRERAQIGRDDVVLAKQLKLKLRPRAMTAAQREALRKLVPLTGARFVSAYRALESKNIQGDITRAANAAKAASSAKTRSQAEKHVVVYRAELRAVQGL